MTTHVESTVSKHEVPSLPLDLKSLDGHQVGVQITTELDRKGRLQETHPFMRGEVDDNNMTPNQRAVDEMYRDSALCRALLLAQVDHLPDDALVGFSYDIFTPALMDSLAKHDPEISRWIDDMDIVTALDIEKGKEARAMLLSVAQQVKKQMAGCLTSYVFDDYCARNSIPPPHNPQDTEVLLERYTADPYYFANILGETLGRSVAQIKQRQELAKQASIAEHQLAASMTIQQEVIALKAENHRLQEEVRTVHELSTVRKVVDEPTSPPVSPELPGGDHVRTFDIPEGIRNSAEKIQSTISAGKSIKGGRELNQDSIWVDDIGLQGAGEHLSSLQGISGYENVSAKGVMASLQHCQREKYIGAVNIVADGTGSVSGSEKKSAQVSLLFTHLLAKEALDYGKLKLGSPFSTIIKNAVHQTARTLGSYPGETNFVASVVGPNGHTYIVSLGDAGAYRLQVKNNRWSAELVSVNTFQEDLCQKDKVELNENYGSHDRPDIIPIENGTHLLDHPQGNISLAMRNVDDKPSPLVIVDAGVIPPDEKILLCSDGLSKGFSETHDEVRRIVQKYDQPLRGVQGSDKYTAWRAAQGELMSHVLNNECKIPVGVNAEGIVMRAVSPSIGTLSRGNVSAVVSERESEEVTQDKKNSSEGKKTSILNSGFFAGVLRKMQL